MARNKFSSPTLILRITEEDREKAVASNSGGCLIADAIKRQYPQFTAVSVDMATVRFSDKKVGSRYAYLTTPPAQHCLLAFDQGWPNPVEEIVLKGAVKISPIKRSRAKAVAKAERVADLQRRVSAGEELTVIDRRALTNLTSTPSRVPSEGPADVKVAAGGSGRGVVVHGGHPLVQGPAHPNLLRGRNRHFGAQLADPGIAFREAVDKAVEERMAAKASE